MIRQAAAAALGFLFAAGGALAADVAPGKAVFDRDCAVCHAPGLAHPGTQRLAQLKGAARAALEQRTDLDPNYIRHVVRHGLVEMPPWRPTELDDAALTQLVQYLTGAK
jgi:mono/diheme cytochrome c family protein